MRTPWPIAFAAAMLASPPAHAQSWAGTWALEAEGRPIQVLTVARDGAGWRARLRSLAWRQDADRAAAVHGPANDVAMTVVATTPSSITLAFADGPALDLRPLSADVAEWRDHDRADRDPEALRRVPAGTAPATGFDPARTYAIDAPWPDSAAMTRLYDADQAAREGDHPDWSVLLPADARRRAETQALLDADALHSGSDFLHAAYVFQHGDAPADFLKAHALAVIAAARGRRDAAWIAAATLDRYLQRAGLKQVYGTQFLTPPGGPSTQEPYDRALLSDGLRRATGVPTLAEQEKERDEWTARMRR